MGELKRFDVEMNGDDLIIDEAPDGDWVRYEDADTLLSQVAIARAEVERLRDVNLALECIRDERPALVARLAAANEEVERLRATLEAEKHRTADEADAIERLAPANALLAEIAAHEPRWSRVIRAHLAAQPATAQALHHGRDECQCPICYPEQPATAPTRAEPPGDWSDLPLANDLKASVARTEAEQRVLDAMGQAHPRALKQCAEVAAETHIAEACRAELALRRLKSLALVEDRTAEQLAADGDEP
jgi:hypothetical protein